MEAVCGILNTDNAVGAQTERPGAAGPVSALFGDENSPAAFFAWIPICHQPRNPSRRRNSEFCESK